MIQTARIALSRPLRRLFDYQVPVGMRLTPGQRVRVPFGRQSLVGLVVETGVEPPAGIKLRPISQVLEDWPVLPPETRQLMQWAAAYYQHPLGECLFMSLPPALRRGRPATANNDLFWHALEEATPEALPAQAHRQKALLTWLRSQPTPCSQSTIQAAGFTPDQIRNLKKRNLIEETEPQPPLAQACEKLPSLTHAQERAFGEIPRPELGFSATLLYGITGSGKTEIYLHYLQRYLKQEQQALVLVPEINLTPQTVRRFNRYFGDRICMWHSALNDGERLKTWLRIRNGEPVIVIGTRSSVTLPFLSLGAIIVDEEHDTSFKQGEGFRYSARDLAVYRGHLNRCPVLLGSATPSIESYQNATTGKYRLVKLEERVGEARPPTLRLLDIRSRPLEGGLSPKAIQAIRERIERKEQVLVFVNRRGFAPVMMCFDCGHISECPRCDSRLTYHRKDRALRCHHCDYQTAAPETCPACASDAYSPVGQGTERTEDILQASFPETPIIRVDRDSTRNRGSIDRILQQVNSGESCILVGTQMLAKGHDFPNVSLVVVVNADGGLFSVDFRAPEQLIQTLLQVSGRAGRGRIPGTVLIQTCHSEHSLLNQLCTGNYLAMAEHILAERAALQLPPYRAMALLRAEATTMEESLAFLDGAKGQLTGSDLEIWGPLPAVIARRAERHRAQLVLISNQKGPLQRQLQTLCHHLEEQKKPSSLKWQIDVDPLETG
ncbi:primosomal protein N' [Marinobacter nanhaiticus D15-8W]|uniref:Replication restart protein PriA n=1 Tax=Marinobacter nanhaiticus D15-8W TaxID=626887 RepID=N6WM89_9GAMM|nr:primosomal protein N' [Marinobacter nanhaiticus]ENO12601.1 primosomal protein N' [Marinobacter nanhaiticus D15-8W]BES69939.1 primosomal protein N' [Marinobacter nanhaiticus D15-8W]